MTESLARLLYRLALLATPPAFRREFGPTMRLDFADLLEESRGLAAQMRTAVAESGNVLRSAWLPTGAGASPRWGVRLALRAATLVGMLRRDLRFAFRALRAEPGFVFASVLTLGIGVGTTTLVFSVIDRVLIQQLPFEGAERLDFVYANDLREERLNLQSLTPADFLDLRRDARGFSHFVGVRQRTVTVRGREGAQRGRLGEVTPETFAMLGVAPLLGRVLLPTDDEGVVLLAHGFWQTAFGGDPEIVGRALDVDGRTRVVVGVMPDGFRPLRASRSQLWTPLRLGAEAAQDRASRVIRAAAKRLPAISRESAQVELQAIAAKLGNDFPGTNADWSVHLMSPAEVYAGNSRNLYALLGVAAALVFALACANATGLVVARAAARESEFAVRRALGAGRLHLAGLLLAEGGLVAGFALVTGVALASWGLGAILPLAPSFPPMLQEAAVGPRAVLFALAIATIAWLLCGTAPLVRSAGRALLGGADALGSRGSTAPAGEMRLRARLVIAQVALAVTLLVGAATILRSIGNILDADLGLDDEGLVTARVALTDPQASPDVFEQIRHRVEGLAGIDAVSLADAEPIGGSGDWAFVFVDGDRALVEGTRGAGFRRVSAEYFDTLGTGTLVGRVLTASDAGSQAAVVNDAFAAAFLPGREPLGEVIEVAPSAAGDDVAARTRHRVVGVVQTVREYGAEPSSPPSVYLPFDADRRRAAVLVMRTRLDAEGLIGPLRTEIGGLVEATVDRVAPVRARYADTYRRHRFLTTLLGGFAAQGLVLAIIGLYGVMAYTVARRQREIGVRLAVGAARRDVSGMIARQSARLALIAIPPGLAGAVPLAYLLGTLDEGRILVAMHWLDPLAFASIPAGALAISLVAALLPARRAARVDPAVALRAEG